VFSARIRENLQTRALYPMFEYMFSLLCRMEKQIAGTGLFSGALFPAFFLRNRTRTLRSPFCM
jgi:hypothetical protein